MLAVNGIFMNLLVTNILYKSDFKGITRFSAKELANNDTIKSHKSIVYVTLPNNLIAYPVSAGQVWKVSGEMTYGEQVIDNYRIKITSLNASKCEVILPVVHEHFIRFIAHETDFEGIGDVKARLIWKEIGSDIYTVLRTKDKDKLRKIKKNNGNQLLSEQIIESFIKGFEKYSNLNEANFFHDKQIPANISQRIIKFHKSDSLVLIKENPYKLMNFGLSFKDADKIAKENFEIEIDDLKRLCAIVQESLRQEQARGHTYTPVHILKTKLRKIIKSDELIEKALKVAIDEKICVLNDISQTYHSLGMLIKERVIAKRFIKLAREKEWTKEYDKAYLKAVNDLPYKLTEKQREAVFTALENQISIITGGAGTGKTTVLRTVLNAYRNLSFNITPVALSGRAAKRIYEATGFKSFTIAKYLKDHKPNDNQLIILVIDESSMIDVATMFKILMKSSSNIRLLFVGDQNQLPPIGAGIILADLLNSSTNIEAVELDIPQRSKNQTGIPQYSKSIVEGKVPVELSMGNISFHEVSENEINDKVIELYMHAPDVTQILGATYRPQFGGIDIINSLCQRAVNGEAEKFTFFLYGDYFKLGLNLNDKIIFTQNNYERDVQNGTLGKLVSVEQTDEKIGSVEIDTGEIVNLNEALLDSIKLAYCISLHKAQGSQFKKIIIPITPSNLLDRSWIYTAVTRAEQSIEIVGSSKLFEHAILKEGANKTCRSYLQHLLTEEYCKSISLENDGFEQFGYLVKKISALQTTDLKKHVKLINLARLYLNDYKGFIHDNSVDSPLYVVAEAIKYIEQNNLDFSAKKLMELSDFEYEDLKNIVVS